MRAPAAPHPGDSAAIHAPPGSARMNDDDTRTRRDTGRGSSEPHPERIGPYRILDVLGSGGMAVVYLAQQTHPIKRRIAVKMIKLGMDTEQVIARFSSERQALAFMDHPNIAKVFDAGISDEGRPYFCMEFVSGVPIDEYCDTNKLSIRDRVDVFLQVCSAVQHAHQKGVIHRDLKPSNILVSNRNNRPLARVIDFGVAKATAADLSDETPVTRFGQVLGTPRYMSPEQAGGSGLVVDTRTDIYSLGVVLYELLAGVPPLDFSGAADFALANVIREKDPQVPSQRVTGPGESPKWIASHRRSDPQTLKRTLKGDLDWIVMKAMAKDPVRRYETVAGLADDLRRFLNHEPVLAHPPSTTYVVKRFVRRNRAIVAAAAIGLVTLLAGVAVATHGLMRARQAEQAQRIEAESARQVSDFLVGLFRVADPGEARGNSVTAREILDEGAKRIDAGLSDQAGVKVTLLETMADVYNALGLYDEARRLYEQALQTLPSAGGGSATQRARLLIESGAALSNAGDHAAAEAVLKEGIGLLDTSDVAERLLAARGLAHLGWALYEQGDYDEAEARYDEAMAVFVADGQRSSLDAAMAMNHLAVLKRTAGELDAAEPLMRESLSVRREKLGRKHPSIAQMQNNLGSLLYEKGEYAEAEFAYREALALRRELLGARHPDYTTTLNNLGLLLRARGRYDEALAALNEVLTIRQQTNDADAPSLAYAFNGLGALNHDMGNLDVATTQYARATEIFERALGPNHVNTAVTRTGLAAVLADRGEFERAHALAVAAETVLSDRLAPDHWRTAVARSVRGAALGGLGDYAAAEPMLLDSLGTIASAKGDDDIAYTGAARARVVALYTRWGKPEQADRYRASPADPGD